MQDNAFHQLKQQAQLQCTREYKARGIKVKRCLYCQLMPDHCICNESPGLPSNVDFILLYHLDEIFKPTNTGRLIADTFPHNTYAFRHSRTEPQKELLALLNDPMRLCVVIFPVSAELNRKVITKVAPKTDKRLTFIMIDGTWRQGRRMFNSSQWLRDCLVLKLTPEDKTLYATRTAACDSHLSTAEAAALGLLNAEENESAQALLDYFNLFNNNYMKIRPRR
jgi:DTW domain-containing protein YfiP